MTQIKWTIGITELLMGLGRGLAYLAIAFGIAVIGATPSLSKQGLTASVDSAGPAFIRQLDTPAVDPR